MEIIVYTTTDCSMCKAAKEFLKANDLAFTERNVSEERQAAKDLIVKCRHRIVSFIQAFVLSFFKLFNKSWHVDNSPSFGFSTIKWFSTATSPSTPARPRTWSR